MMDLKAKFGDVVENGWASENNPTRVGFFVRAGKRTGRMNAGKFWEITDGKGKFWELMPTGDHKITVTERKPVAWRVKDFADGWILCHSEAEAKREAESAGNLIQALGVISPGQLEPVAWGWATRFRSQWGCNAWSADEGSEKPDVKLFDGVSGYEIMPLYTTPPKCSEAQLLAKSASYSNPPPIPNECYAAHGEYEQSVKTKE